MIGKCIRTYQGYSSVVNSAEYSNDGNRIVSASDDYTIKEWDVLTGECIRILENIPGLIIHGCSFNNLHNASDISMEGMELLKQYGAKEISIAMPDSQEASENCNIKRKNGAAM